MLIRRMNATFGRLQNASLTLKDGLNILEAPNEAGKSTWCAFLLSMLYGVNSQERDQAGCLADRNHFAPWNGSPMGGRMDVQAAEGELTLTRSTSRQAAPMADFRAVYAGTGETVPGLTDQTCGETLLGVSREVYERSAFIRQAGLPVSRDAGLERRITALISSGGEDTSYEEASDALKRQMNRRRNNQNGQIPNLEKELRTIRQQISRSEELERQLTEARSRLVRLEQREAALRLELAGIERWEASRGRQDTEDSVSQAAVRADALRQELEEQRIPEMETIARLRGAVVNLLTAQKAARKAAEEQEEAEKKLREAEAAASQSPFAGMTPTEAEHAPVDLPPEPVFPLWLGWALAGLGIALGAALYMATMSLVSGVITAVICAAAMLIPSQVLVDQRRESWEALAQRKNKRHQAELDRYAGLYLALEDARMDAAAKTSASRSIGGAFQTNEQAFLAEVHRFAPEVTELLEADERLRSAAQRRRELSAVQNALRERALRREILEEQQGTGEGSGVREPLRTKEEVVRELDRARQDLDEARAAAGNLTGELHAAGDLVVLRSAAARTQDDLGVLEEEYEALKLASDTLDHANAALQSRFSPALAKRASEIFRELTEGRYENLTMDRSFRMFAEAGDAYRSSMYLSAGCADQMYLAVRLAVCELVLPVDRVVPIVLDDALTNFDDSRCAAALRFLKKEAEKRQILLFTCHSREAAFFKGDSSVFVQKLPGAK